MIANQVPVPVIACGGAGQKEHVVEAVSEGMADAVCAASLFHYQYMEQLETLYMSSDEPKLRMGKQVDEGNVDYLKTRTCGGFPWTVITPASIPEVKELMTNADIDIRKTGNPPLSPTLTGTTA
jgi:cyclase